MADCDVCIGIDFMDLDGSPDLHKARQPKARKEHKCEECRETIPRGAKYERVSGKFDGDFYDVKTCLSCAEIREVFACDNAVNYGDLWSEIREYVFPELTTATKCLQKLIPSNRARVILKWQQWKGLEAPRG